MRHVLDYAEFYITNVCNFNCSGCNRFNNWYFSGQQKWEDYADVYKEWSNLIDLKKIGLLGGEPLLNPSINEWIDGIATLWPSTSIKVTTNGTRLNKVKGLYDTIVKYKGRVRLDVGLHNMNRRDEIIKECKEFLNAIDDCYEKRLPNSDWHWNNAYNDVRDDSWPDCNTVEDYRRLPLSIQQECKTIHGISDTVFIKEHSNVQLIDINGVKITIEPNNTFYQSSIIEDNGVFSLRNSNPDKAHEICDVKTCHHFIRGKLYKCGVAALLPEFYEQFHFNVSEKDKELMHSYAPLTTQDTDKKIKEFIAGIKNKIPQCKFCSDNLVTANIKAGTSKTRIKKKL